MIYLDNAATGGKKPEEVIRAVDLALRRHSANPGRSGHKASISAGNLVYECRKKAADFFGCESPDCVCFTSGCTAALNMALKGILRRGDRVIASSLEHNAVMRPLHSLKENGVGVDIAAVVPGNPEATIAAFLAAIGPDTRAVVCTHASNVTGEIMPISRLGDICRKRGITFIVDAAQTAGVIPINMEEMGIDILCAAPHKGLLGPMGVGLLISRVPLPQTIIEGGTGSLSVSPLPPDALPDRIESGTLPLPAIAGLSAALDHLGRTDRNAVYRRELSLISLCHKMLRRNPRVILYTPEPEAGRYAPVLSFNIRGLSSTETAARLDQRGIALRGGLHCAPSAHRMLGTIDSGTARVSTSYFNTKQDIFSLVSAVEAITKSH